MTKDEQRVRTAALQIGVELSKSRVRTPGRPGYGLFRARGMPRSTDLPEDLDEMWTPYAFTLAEIEQAVAGAVLMGVPSGPADLRLFDGRDEYVVPTRWTSRYAGRRDLGVDGARALDAGLGDTDPEVGRAAQRMREVRERIRRREAPVPVTVRREFADEVSALAALVDAGLVVMLHAPGCTCSGIDRLMAECVRRTIAHREWPAVDFECLDVTEPDGVICHGTVHVEAGAPEGPCDACGGRCGRHAPGVAMRSTVRSRQRAANADFQREHQAARDAGLRARHAAKQRRTLDG